jgi:hypothetical protein
MDHVGRFWQFTRARAGEARQRVRAYASVPPNWIARVALLAIIIVVATPILVLAVLVALITVIGLIMASTVNMLIGAITGIIPRRDGRENVRVIVRREP